MAKPLTGLIEQSLAINSKHRQTRFHSRTEGMLVEPVKFLFPSCLPRSDLHGRGTGSGATGKPRDKRYKPRTPTVTLPIQLSYLLKDIKYMGSVTSPEARTSGHRYIY